MRPLTDSGWVAVAVAEPGSWWRSNPTTDPSLASTRFHITFHLFLVWFIIAESE